jgi:Leucine-rich repeat (LRR) protein
LQSLPESIGNLVKLTSLWLSHNRLQSLPESIGNLVNLTNLRFDHNQLQSLPESIGNLVMLTSLWLSNNQLQSLPESIGNLVMLTSLWLDYNQLQSLPESIGNLVNLTDLRFDHNQLQSLPESIGNLVNLTDLRLDLNRLQSLPESIGNLLKLKELWLDLNRLQSLPESIGNLLKLKELWLSHNRLQSLPESIGNLVNLKKLNLWGNQLQSLPASIENLVNLESLDLTNNHFNSVPECLLRLSTNCTINLEGNPLRGEEIARLRQRINQPGYHGPQFIFSVHESRPQNVPTRPQQVSTRSFESTLPNWCNETCQCQLLAKLPEPVKTDLSNWFSRIQQIPYYTSNPTAAKGQIALFLNWLANEENQDHLDIAYTILSQATSTCGDRVALSVNELLLHVKLCQSQQLTPAELKELIMGSVKLAELYEIAQETSASQRLTDPIEVFLCYQIRLKEALNLPIETTSMLYEGLADLSEQDILTAKERIMHKISTPQQQAQCLMENAFWVKAIQSRLTPAHLAQAEACFSFESSEIQAHIHSILARMDLQSSVSIYDQISQLCEQDKEDKMNAVLNGGNLNEINTFHQEFKIKEPTVWNPHYLATLLFLYPQ